MAAIEGQKLLVLKATKMEHALVAQVDGVVIEPKAVAGSLVSESIVLVRVEQEGER